MPLPGQERRMLLYNATGRRFPDSKGDIIHPLGVWVLRGANAPVQPDQGVLITAPRARDHRSACGVAERTCLRLPGANRVRPDGCRRLLTPEVMFTNSLESGVLPQANNTAIRTTPVIFA